MEILDDIETIIGDLKEDSDYIYDRAFMEMMQLQLQRIEDYREEIHNLIGLRNSIAESFNAKKNTISEPEEDIPVQFEKHFNEYSTKKQGDVTNILEKIYYPDESSKKREQPKKGDETEEVVSPPKENIISNTSTKKMAKFQFEDSSKKPPRMTLNESTKRLDQLVQVCHSKDEEISFLTGKNLRSKEELKRINLTIEDLREKDAEITQLKDLKNKLENEIKILQDQINSEKSILQEKERMEQEVEYLVSEVERVQDTIRDLLIDETNKEMADDLKDYHLKIKLFIYMKMYLRDKRLTSVADQFREYNLKVNLFKDYRKNKELMRRYVIY